MRKLLGAGALALAMGMLSAPGAAIARDTPSAETPKEAKAGEAAAAMAQFQKSLHPQTGDVRIPEAKAVLHLGDRYYFLGPAEAKRVLIDAWGNPPSAGEGVLGLVVENGKSVFDSVWGAVITYENGGHVSDADAKDQDYAAVLDKMKEAQEADNPERVKGGYPEMHLLGWAQPPSYDPASHALIWAREFRVGNAADNSLNYDVRLLGRTGVLSLNMLAEMSKIGEVRDAAQAFGRAVTFEPGASYADYNASTDKTAEYVLAGLVAGGAMLAVAQKVGLLALVLKFGKLILLGVVALGAGGWAFVKRVLERRQPEDVI